MLILLPLGGLFKSLGRGILQYILICLAIIVGLFLVVPFLAIMGGFVHAETRRKLPTATLRERVAIVKDDGITLDNHSLDEWKSLALGSFYLGPMISGICFAWFNFDFPPLEIRVGIAIAGTIWSLCWLLAYAASPAQSTQSTTTARAALKRNDAPLCGVADARLPDGVCLLDEGHAGPHGSE